MVALTITPMMTVNPELVPTLCVFALVAALAALALSVWLLFEHLALRRSLRSLEDSLRDEIVEVVLRSSRVGHFIRGLASKIDRPICLSNESIDSVTNLVMAKVEERIESLVPPAGERGSKPTESGIRRLYAPAYASESEIWKLTDQLDEDTAVYVLEVDEDEASGSFTIYEGAKERVAECRDFLRGASQVEGSGDNIEILSPGTVALEGGKWVVKEKLRIRFS